VKVLLLAQALHTNGGFALQRQRISDRINEETIVTQDQK
jgi:hypothetical protein